MSQEFGFEPEEKSPSAKTKKGVLISVIAAAAAVLVALGGVTVWLLYGAEK